MVIPVEKLEKEMNVYELSQIRFYRIRAECINWITVAPVSVLVCIENWAAKA